MEIKFDQTSCRCLKKLTNQVQQKELTQEVRLPEAMPDIGRILGCWGQVILRGKEWRGGAMGGHGGVMARVLYAPEDGSRPRSVEAWVPFHMKWDLPQTQHDGYICMMPLLKGMDCRGTSARKIMVRATVGVRAQALENGEQGICMPPELPGDVQVLKNTYPMDLPREFGEKLFPVEEEWTSPGDGPAMEEILNFTCLPRITEEKIMASRLVFRGKLLLSALYWGDSGLNRWETEVPFSQYADLDRDYGADASARILPVLTDGELTLSEGKILLKAGICAQFTIFDREMVTVAEDAYSHRRDLQIHKQQLCLPARLEQRMQPLTARCAVDGEAARILDVTWVPDHPCKEGDGILVGGAFQVLYEDRAGSIQTASARWEEELSPDWDGAAIPEGYCLPVNFAGGEVTGNGMELTAEAVLDSAVFAGQGLEMISAMDLGAESAPDPARPSLILRRCTDQGLWTLAKESGSTVEAICLANSLDGEPEDGRMLLIPVI